MVVLTEKNDAAVILCRFNKIVLSWDYFSLLPNLKDKKKKLKISKEDAKKLGLKKVKKSYKTVDDYIKTFEPLLFEEVKAQIIQGKSKDDDDDVGVSKFGCISSYTEADGFHLPMVVFEAEEDDRIAENDLLLVTEHQIEKTLPKMYAFAFVLNREGRNQMKLRMFVGGEFEGINTDKIKHIPPRMSEMHKFFGKEQAKRSMCFVKVAGLSTIIREYVALMSVKSLPFKDLILSASEKDATSEHRPWKIPRPLMQSLENNHNSSQLDAIREGLSRKSVVLIQGPPGTGKTQTILGLLSAVLHATPTTLQSKGEKLEIIRQPEMSISEKYDHWKIASPWLYGCNPRDLIMPIDGDDGFYPTSGNDMKPEVVNSNRKYRARVLVCAPSNSALDEIVLRLLNTGIRDEKDRPYNPKIVRIGLKAHHSVQAVAMDYLVNQKLAGMNTTADIRKQGSGADDRDSIRASILSEAAIVFSTLSYSGSTLFSKLNHGFDVVIIDEAAQAVEGATLIPLANGCKQVFLVGDPVQLPATVISTIAQKFGYGMSLFSRFQEAGYPVQMLKTQYRMHPEIRHFPSKEFYSAALKDGEEVKEQTIRPWHDFKCFGPFCFFDIEDGIESGSEDTDQSKVNFDEVEFVLLMYHKLVKNYPKLKSSSQLAIITPYAKQMKLFRDRFRETFGMESNKFVDINTVDGFQGREKDVAIFSCVRANKEGKIGFLGNFRRMNVGITRARSSVLVVGSASTLKKDKHWNSLVESARERGCLFKVQKPYGSYFSDENLESMKVAESQLERMEGHMNDMENNANMDVNPMVEDVDQANVDDEDGGDGDGGDGNDD
ncbi:hypothetical protein C5167_037097 [Papaver somniferum]|uniref:Helicase ATP-binding domain-containing protein n=1 Tax=Papaver somniferum TaxID=3469 RepID=A0A4Y7I9R8_PAPSO|nr:probable helicase MAGATAMA 3 [Papaver somniferum]RZC44139.1 hypothetical protein C5167_037097 [Papaver somniferum]